MPDIKEMPVSYYMPSIEHKRPPFTVNNTEMPNKEHMTANKHNKPSLTDNDKHMPID